MHLNITPNPPPAKPCMRDMHELLHVVLTPQLLMLSPLEELARRLREVAAQRSRFRNGVTAGAAGTVQGTPGLAWPGPPRLALKSWASTRVALPAAACWPPMAYGMRWARPRAWARGRRAATRRSGPGGGWPRSHHTNEYVIPEWMRADPQVVQVEHWLEARRQRGSFYEGGPTSAGAGRTAPAVGVGEPAGGNSQAQLL